MAAITAMVFNAAQQYYTKDLKVEGDFAYWNEGEGGLIPLLVGCIGKWETPFNIMPLFLWLMTTVGILAFGYETYHLANNGVIFYATPLIPVGFFFAIKQAKAKFTYRLFLRERDLAPMVVDEEAFWEQLLQDDDKEPSTFFYRNTELEVRRRVGEWASNRFGSSKANAVFTTRTDEEVKFVTPLMWIAGMFFAAMVLVGLVTVFQMRKSPSPSHPPAIQQQAGSPK